MTKTTFTGYFPKLKAHRAATVKSGKCINPKGSIRYQIKGECMDDEKGLCITLPKMVTREDFEQVYGFDAKEAESVFMADTVGSPSPASVEPPAPSEKPFPQEPSNENFSAEYEGWSLADLINARMEAAKEEGIEDWENDSNPNALSGHIQTYIWKHKDFDAEVKEAFLGFGKDDEEEPEEEKPKEQEFTVIMQEGDKLELTDIEEKEEDGDEPKDEDNGEDEENDEKEDEDDESEAEMDKGILMICPSCDETVPEYSSCMACGQQFGSEYEAVSAKVTRPVKEEEEKEEPEDEEGMSTLMKVGLGVGALAVGAAILGAEEQVAVMWEGKDDNNDGLIYGIEYYGEDGEFSDVEWFRTAAERDAMMLDNEGESDYWAGENTHWRAEGSGEDFQNMTSSEFVPFDQITAEIQEEWDETTVPVAADYEPLNEPTNANFSAEDKRCSGCFEIVREGSINEACNGEMVCDECWNCAFCENCDACTDHQECECGCEVCGYTECECETKEAESNTMKWALGLTAIGVSLAALGYSDKMLSFFDRFKK